MLKISRYFKEGFVLIRRDILLTFNIVRSRYIWTLTQVCFFPVYLNIFMLWRLSAFIWRYQPLNWMNSLEFQLFNICHSGKWPKTMGHLSQSLFQCHVWTFPLLFHYQLSRFGVDLRWCLHLEDFATNRQHAVRGALHAGDTSLLKLRKQKTNTWEIGTILAKPTVW